MLHRVARVARGEIAFSINPDLAVKSTRSTSIRRRRAGVAYSVPSSPNSHNALHRSQISKLRRRKEGKERREVGKNLGSVVFCAPFFFNLFSRHRDENGVARKHRSSLFLLNSLARSLGPPTDQKEDNSLITIAGELPAYPPAAMPPQMDGGSVSDHATDERKDGRTLRRLVGHIRQTGWKGGKEGERRGADRMTR